VTVSESLIGIVEHQDVWCVPTIRLATCNQKMGALRRGQVRVVPPLLGGMLRARLRHCSIVTLSWNRGEFSAAMKSSSLVGPPLAAGLNRNVVLDVRRAQ